MMTARRRIALPALLVAALFAVQTAAPRAPFVFHTHAGGGHTHTHRDAALLAELGLADLIEARPHTHADDGRPGLRAATADHTGHYHQRQYMQSAALPRLAVVFTVVPLGRVAVAAPLPALRAAAAPATARGPPASLLG